MTSLDFTLIGPGRLGLQLAYALVGAGMSCRAVRCRSFPHAAARSQLPDSVVWDTWAAPGISDLSPLVLITTPDHIIPEIARELASNHDLDGKAVIHTSGLHTAQSLAPCAARGAAVASWHPLQAFQPLWSAGPTTWKGVPCAVEGDPTATDLGIVMARRLEMRPWQILPEHKALYHASAAVAGNLTHILIVCARQLLATCGLPPDLGRDALSALVRSSVDGALGATAFEALTGAIARKDRATVERHLTALPVELSQTYSILASVAGLTDASRCLD